MYNSIFSLILYFLFFVNFCIGLFQYGTTWWFEIKIDPEPKVHCSRFILRWWSSSHWSNKSNHTNILIWAKMHNLKRNIFFVLPATILQMSSAAPLNSSHYIRPFPQTSLHSIWGSDGYLWRCLTDEKHSVSYLVPLSSISGMETDTFSKHVLSTPINVKKAKFNE